MAVPRWLDIAVTNGGASQTLSPRVQILPTPYAQFAAVAGAVANGVVVNAGGITNNLKIVYGAIAGDGTTAVSGSGGFSSSRESSGLYHVTFSPQFSAIPVITLGQVTTNVYPGARYIIFLPPIKARPDFIFSVSVRQNLSISWRLGRNRTRQRENDFIFWHICFLVCCLIYYPHSAKQQSFHNHPQRDCRRRHDIQHQQPLSIGQHHRPAARRRAEQQPFFHPRRLLDLAVAHHLCANQSREQFYRLNPDRAGKNLHGAIREFPFGTKLAESAEHPRRWHGENGDEFRSQCDATVLSAYRAVTAKNQICAPSIPGIAK